MTVSAAASTVTARFQCSIDAVWLALVAAFPFVVLCFSALPVDDSDLLAEAVAEQLLARWGVVFRDVIAREQLALPWREVERLYQACDVFVMPSRQEGTDVEGLGMVYLEAGLRGKPVIGGRSGGIPDAVRDGETGFLVDPSDPEDLARALGRLLSDEGLRRRMGENGRRRVLDEFSIERSAVQLRAALWDAAGES